MNPPASLLQQTSGVGVSGVGVGVSGVGVGVRGRPQGVWIGITGLMFDAAAADAAAAAAGAGAKRSRLRHVHVSDDFVDGGDVGCDKGHCFGAHGAHALGDGERTHFLWCGF